MTDLTAAEQQRQATDLVGKLISVLPEDVPVDVAALAALTLVRYIATFDPSQAPRIAAVLTHVSHELVTGQLFNNPTH